MLPLDFETLATQHGGGSSRTSQIAAGMRDLILRGVLQPGEAVPSSRALAGQLGVARGTVVAAYDQLVGESYFVSSPGAPTRVHPRAGALAQVTLKGTQENQVGAMPVPLREQMPKSLSPLNHSADSPSEVIDLRPQHRRALTMDDAVWRAAWRRAATANPLDQVGSTDRSGQVQLRQAISEHLRLTRSLIVHPDQIFITGGAREGLDLVLAALGPRLQPLAIEQPGYRGLQQLLIRRRTTTTQVAADQHGILPQEIAPTTKSVLVTPNHLYPLGGAMPAPRRHELLSRMTEIGGVVLEDDYDSEFRHLTTPIPTLWELAPDRVVHLGTFHQVLSPEVHIGYLIAPTWMHQDLLLARADLGGGASPITQRAVGDYLSGGGLRRHLARRRRDLLRRRALVQEALTDLQVETVSGSCAIITTPSPEQTRALQAILATQGIALSTTTEYWQHASGEEPYAGLVINYADSALTQLDFALSRISAELDAVRAPV